MNGGIDLDECRAAESCKGPSLVRRASVKAVFVRFDKESEANELFSNTDFTGELQCTSGKGYFTFPILSRLLQAAVCNSVGKVRNSVCKFTDATTG
mmetsp:Transcript_10975/g.15107  ORF Transcript_10975/g.15107 Transcript_10975/m.15107 type:complete len:96 (-) Transcript_10975:424-711(-)